MKKAIPVLALVMCIGWTVFLPKAQAAFLSVSPIGSFDAVDAGVTSITFDVYFNVEGNESFTFYSWDFDMQYDATELANWSASSVLAGSITEVSGATLNSLYFSLPPDPGVTFDSPGAHLLASITFDIIDPVQEFDGRADFGVVSQIDDPFDGLFDDQGAIHQFARADGADVGSSGSPANIGPTAEAGGNRSVPEGSTVILDGTSSSDPDDGIDAYLWQQTGGPTVVLTGPANAQASFTAPEVGSEGEVLTFQLTVADHEGLFSSDSVVVTVLDSSENTPPAANAGSDQSANEGASVMLDGSLSSDSDDGIESYLWEQTDGPPVSLTGASSAQASFPAPEVGPEGAALTFQLTVTDHEGLFTSDSVVVHVVDSGLNTPPTADAGSDQTVDEGVSVTLDGSGSSDPDDNIASYFWEQLDGPPVLLSGTDSAQASFTTPLTGSEGATLTFLLTVTDEGGLWNTDLVSVTVTPGGDPVVSDMDGIYKDDKLTINAYVQTYTSGEILVILTPDLVHFYVFLDSDWTDGITAGPDLANQGHKLTMSFLPNGNALTALVYGQGGSDSWVLEPVYRALQNSPLSDGIYKQGQDMNLYVQTYAEGSAIFIFTPNALEWKVFLTSDYSGDISVSNDLGYTQHTLVMTSAGSNAYEAVVTPSSGPADTYLLDRTYAAPKGILEQ